MFGVECSAHGRCDRSRGVCVCDIELDYVYRGPACEEKSCPSNSADVECSGHGRCVNGACVCTTPVCDVIDGHARCRREGYTGTACETRAQCCSCSDTNGRVKNMKCEPNGLYARGEDLCDPFSYKAALGTAATAWRAANPKAAETWEGTVGECQTESGLCECSSRHSGDTCGKCSREYAATDWPRCASSLQYFERVWAGPPPPPVVVPKALGGPSPEKQQKASFPVKDATGPIGRSEMSVVSIQTAAERKPNCPSKWGMFDYSLYVFGGYNPTAWCDKRLGASPRVAVLKNDTEASEMGLSLPLTRGRTPCTTHLGDFWQFNLTNATLGIPAWKELPSRDHGQDENAPPPRRGHCSFVRGGRHVVIYGGVHQAWGYEGCSPESASTCRYLHDMRQYDTQKKKWWAVAQTSEEEMGLPQGRTGHVCAHKDSWHNAEVLVVWGGEGYGYEQVSGAYVDDGPWLFTFSTAAASEKQPSGAWRRLVPAGGVPQPKPWGAVGAMEQDALVLYGGLPTHDPLHIPKGGRSSSRRQARCGGCSGSRSGRSPPPSRRRDAARAAPSSRSRAPHSPTAPSETLPPSGSAACVRMQSPSRATAARWSLGRGSRAGSRRGRHASRAERSASWRRTRRSRRRTSASRLARSC